MREPSVCARRSGGRGLSDPRRTPCWQARETELREYLLRRKCVRPSAAVDEQSRYVDARALSMQHALQLLLPHAFDE